MSKRLEELFELEPTPEKSNESPVSTELPRELLTTETLSTIEKIEHALPTVNGLDISDVKLDELSDMAKGEFRNLMELGMQVDSRFSSEIFSVASTLLGHAITTETAKINRKLKMVDLQLKKAELERKIAQQETKSTNLTDIPLESAQVFDRTQLLRAILKESQDAKISEEDK